MLGAHDVILKEKIEASQSLWLLCEGGRLKPGQRGARALDLGGLWEGPRCSLAHQITWGIFFVWSTLRFAKHVHRRW